jgi:hypothetical protein
VTIAHCRTVLGEVLYCLKRSTIYQVGMVFCSRHKPDISVGCLAGIKALEKPFSITRGHVLDCGSTRLSILCKTMLAPGAWTRVEANGWILFGVVDAVIPTSMMASCVDIQLEAAFPAASALPAETAQPRPDERPTPAYPALWAMAAGAAARAPGVIGEVAITPTV